MAILYNNSKSSFSTNKVKAKVHFNHYSNDKITEKKESKDKTLRELKRKYIGLYILEEGFSGKIELLKIIDVEKTPFFEDLVLKVKNIRGFHTTRPLTSSMSTITENQAKVLRIRETKQKLKQNINEIFRTREVLQVPFSFESWLSGDSEQIINYINTYWEGARIVEFSDLASS